MERKAKIKYILITSSLHDSMNTAFCSLYKHQKQFSWMVSLPPKQRWYQLGDMNTGFWLVDVQQQTLITESFGAAPVRCRNTHQERCNLEDRKSSAERHSDPQHISLSFLLSLSCWTSFVSQSINMWYFAINSFPFYRSTQWHFAFSAGITRCRCLK